MKELQKHQQLLRALMALVTAGGLITACVGQNPEPTLSEAWRFDDLRFIEDADGSLPACDIIAAYTRNRPDGFEVRVDFLDIDSPLECDLYLAIDTEAGGERDLPTGLSTDLDWDWLVQIPAGDEALLWNAEGEQVEGVLKSWQIDPALDTGVIGFGAGEISPQTEGYKFQLLLTRPDSKVETDRSQVFRKGVFRAPQANVILTFWDVLSGYTPVQTLRRWDGAHTGPFGQRHGLYRLLEASSQAGVPVVLLDLKTPESLSALDLLGKRAYVRELEKKGLVILPDAAIGDPVLTPISLEANRKIVNQFGFDKSRLLFATMAHEMAGDYQGAFVDPRAISIPTIRVMQTDTGLRLFPLPIPVFLDDEAVFTNQLDRQGLTIEVKRSLISQALNRQEGSLLSLGGSLPLSGWADSSIVEPVFHYLAGHPWINLLDEGDLMSIQTTGIQTDQWNCTDLLCGEESGNGRPEIATEIKTLPSNTLAQEALRLYQRLSMPEDEVNLKTLRQEYFIVVERLIAAAEWAQQPHAIQTCNAAGSCILANEEHFLWIESRGGRLALAVTLVGGKPLQWAGSRSQLLVGASDPLTWRKANGEASDPQEIGSGLGNEWETNYTARFSADEITLKRGDGLLSKKFHLTSEAVEIEMLSGDLFQYPFWVTLNPAQRFTLGWRDRYRLNQGTSNTWQWGEAQKQKIQLKLEGGVFTSKTTFNDFPEFLNAPEDPDREILPGQMFAFPMAQAEVECIGNNTPCRLVVSFQ